MQNQNELKCDGCGQQFGNRGDLEKHRANCAALKAKGSSGQGQQSGHQPNRPMTHGAGGGQNRE